MAESSCPYCAERDAHPMAHAPRWNAMLAVYREVHGHYPACPTQERRAARTLAAAPRGDGEMSITEAEWTTDDRNR